MSDPRMRLVAGAGEKSEAEIVEALSKTIRIVLPEDPDLGHQVLALALVDLLTRLFAHLDLACPSTITAHPDLPPDPKRDQLVERLEAVRSNGLIDPEPAEEPALVIVIGPDIGADLVVDGAGWISYLGREPSGLERGPSPITIGPLMAAARGAAAATQILLGGLLRRAYELPQAAYFSALTLQSSVDPLVGPEIAAPLNLDAVLVGGGSVGGAAVYAFARTSGLDGQLAIVDPQNLEATNPDRALLATREVVKAETEKATVAKDALAHLPLIASSQVSTIADYYGSRPRKEPLPLVLCAVDSIASRREIQDCLPLEVINAACGPDQVTVSGHTTDQGACLYCLHLDQVLDSDSILLRQVARAAGMAERQTFEFLDTGRPLDQGTVFFIERQRGLNPGDLAGYIGRPLVELYTDRLRYGETAVTTADGGEAVVAAPYTTALAGILLAAEALKAAGGTDYEPYRLGPGSARIGQIKFQEAIDRSPLTAVLSQVPRDETGVCLCRSVRRLRLLGERYQVQGRP